MDKDQNHTSTTTTPSVCCKRKREDTTTTTTTSSSSIPQPQQQRNSRNPTPTDGTTTTNDNDDTNDDTTTVRSNSCIIGTYPIDDEENQRQRRVYYHSTRIKVRRETFYSPEEYTNCTTTTEEDDDDGRWKVRVGDVLIVSDTDANQRDDSFQNTNWFSSDYYPFTVPWNVVQILAIYRDYLPLSNTNGETTDTNNETTTVNVQFEVRKYYRRSDLDRRFATTLPKHTKSSKTQQEQLFETPHVHQSLSPHSILGMVEFGPVNYHDERSTSTSTTDILTNTNTSRTNGVKPFTALLSHVRSKVPTVRHDCTHLYLHHERGILPIHPYGRDSLDRILSFSDLLSSSHIIRDDTGGGGGSTSSSQRGTMVNAIRTGLGIVVPSITAGLRDGRRQEGGIDAPQRELYCGSSYYGHSNNNKNSSSSSSERLKLTNLNKTQHKTYTANDYFTSIGLPYQWDHFIYGDKMCAPHDRNPNWRWRPAVGNIVAAQCPWCKGSSSSSSSSSSKTKGGGKGKRRAVAGPSYFPYTVVWRPCQILAIYTKAAKPPPPPPKGRSSGRGKQKSKAKHTVIDIEVRWFYRREDCGQGRSVSCDTTTFETDHVTIISAEHLLGPIELDASINTNTNTNSNDEENDSNTDNEDTIASSHNHTHTHDDTIGEKIPKVQLQLSPRFYTKGNGFQNTEGEENNLLLRGVSCKGFSLVTAYPMYLDWVRRVLVEDYRSRSSLSLILPSSEDEGDGETKVEEDRLPALKRQRIRNGKDSTTPCAKRDTTTSKKPTITNATVDIDMDVDEEKVVWMSKAPYHVDISAIKAFYPQITISIPFDSYAPPYNTPPQTQSQSHWTIRLGDIVAVYGVDDKATTVLKKKKMKRKSLGNIQTTGRYPYRVTCFYGEVLSIVRNLGGTEEAVRLKKDGAISIPIADVDADAMDVDVDSKTVQKAYYEDFTIELRWFYEKSDIPGVQSKSSSSSNDNNLDLDEIFETDNVGEAPAEALLGPLALHHHQSNSNDEQQRLSSLPPNNKADHHNRNEESITTSTSGMPILHYYCHRFWSAHRKSLMPIGTSHNRLQRGWMYSKYQDEVARAASGKSTIDGGAGSSHDRYRKQLNNNRNRHRPWRERFHDAFSRLTLTQALADVKTASGGTGGGGLVGREAEQKQISTFLRSAISSVNPKVHNGTGDSGRGGMGDNANVTFSLFVAGPPGTGKTASVSSIISRLRREQSDGNISTFQYVALNGMEMRHPFDAYVRLWEAVSPNKDKLQAGQAVAQLEAYFGGAVVVPKDKDGGKDHTDHDNNDDKDADKDVPVRKRAITVVLLDEIDYMLTKKQTVLYNLFDWPIRGALAKSYAQLIVLGISNTLNLPERLHPRVQSRLGKERCIYSSYKAQESADILRARLGITKAAPESIFQEDAITFAARKMASDSGDIRKAFYLCKAAAEAVYTELDTNPPTSSNNQKPNGPWVKIGDVQRASREMFSTVIHKAVSHATRFEALLLVSIAHLKRDTGREKGGFDIGEILERMRRLASSFGGGNCYSPPPCFEELLGILNRFGEARVLVTTTPNGKDHDYGIGVSSTTVVLQLEDYEVLNALTDTPHQKLAEKYLARTRFF